MAIMSEPNALCVVHGYLKVMMVLSLVLAELTWLLQTASVW